MHKKNIFNRTHLAITASAVALFTVLIAGAASSSAQEAPPDTAPGSTLEQRVEQRKQERAVALEDKDQKRLINTCIGAQSKVRVSQQKFTGALAKRSEVYQQIDGRLLIMIGKLKLAQKDTFEFEKQRIELTEKTAAYKATGESYKQALDDLVVINCKADPIAFKSMLDTARAYNADLRTQSTDIKAFVVDTIKPTLSGFASDLQGGKPAASDRESE